MPKIPGSESLGGPNVPRGTRPIITGADTGAGMVGKGLERIGGTVAAIGEEQRQQEDALDLIKADNDLQEGLRATRRGFETDPDYKTYGPRFDEQVAPLTDAAAAKIRNPNTRAKFLERAKGQTIGTRESVLSRGLGLEREHKEIEVEDTLSKSQGAYAATRDPVERQRILDGIHETTTLAERTGLIRPKKAEHYRDRFVDDTISLDLDERRISDPYGVARDLGIVPGGRKPASVTTGGFKEVDRTDARLPQGGEIKPKGIVFHHTSGTTTDGAVTTLRKRGLSYNYLIEPDGTVVTVVPGGTKALHMKPDEHGRGLGNDNTIGISFVAPNAKAVTDAQRAAGRALAAREAKRFGIAKESVFGHGEVNKHKEHDEGFDDARTIRERGFEDGPAAEEPDPAPDVLPFGDPETPPSPEEAASPYRALYSRLSGRRRQIEIGKTRVALSHKTQDEINNDLASVEEGGEEKLDERGETAFMRASRILQPNVLAQWKTKRDKAFLKRDALRALDNMPEDQVDDHIRSIGRDPRTGEAREDIGYANIKAVRDQAEKQWEKIRKQRREDPASAVAKSPEVQRAAAVANSGSKEVAITMDEYGDPVFARPDLTPIQQRVAATQIVEATMAAQERLGVPKDYQRRISKRQAEKLLDMRDPAKLTSNQQKDALRAAAGRATDLFGPEVGEKVFEDALILAFNPNADNLKSYNKYGRFAAEDSTAAQERFKLLAKEAFGGSISQQDMGRVQQLERLDAIPPVLPRLNPGRPAIGQPAPQTSRQPSEGHVKLLMQQMAVDPTKAREIFDSKFGEGAARRAVNRTIEGEMESP